MFLNRRSDGNRPLRPQLTAFAKFLRVCGRRFDPTGSRNYPHCCDGPIAVISFQVLRALTLLPEVPQHGPPEAIPLCAACFSEAMPVRWNYAFQGARLNVGFTLADPPSNFSNSRLIWIAPKCDDGVKLRATARIIPDRLSLPQDGFHYQTPGFNPRAPGIIPACDL